MKQLIDVIGTPAMLEQTAEEANELAFACLKLARMLRGENKVYGRTEEELVDNLEEEFADVLVCLDQLREVVVGSEEVKQWKLHKQRRMAHRLKEVV